MSTVELANSLSASFFQSRSLSASTSNTSSDGEEISNLRASQKTTVKASLESYQSINKKNEKNVSISKKAEFSFKFSQTTQVAVGQHGKSPIFGSKQLPSSNVTQASDNNAAENNQDDGSLFDKDSLSQQIFEDNVALFDDYLKNQDKELSKENVNDFVKLMKESIPEGFSQARGKLNGLDAMNENDDQKLENVNNKVMEKLEQFQESMNEKIESGEISSAEDLELSNLPGVESSEKGLRIGQKVSISIKLVEKSKLTIGERARQSSKPSESINESNQENNSSEQSSDSQSPNSTSLFDANSLSNSIFDQARSMFENFFGPKNSSGDDEKRNDFSNIMEQSLPKGIEEAQKELNQTETFSKDINQTLENVKSNLLDKIAKF